MTVYLIGLSLAAWLVIELLYLLLWFDNLLNDAQDPSIFQLAKDQPLHYVQTHLDIIFVLTVY